MTRTAPTLLLLLLINACQGPNPEMIVGTWKVDSTYQFYNGFDVSTDEGNWPMFSYGEDGLLREEKDEQTRSYLYEFLEGDTLIVTPAQGGAATKYEVMVLNAEKMVLRLRRDPVFGGSASEERYEVRYFSKVAGDASEELFSDPRQVGD